MDGILETYEDMAEFPPEITQLSFSVKYCGNSTSVCIIRNRQISYEILYISRSSKTCGPFY